MYEIVVTGSTSGAWACGSRRDAEKEARRRLASEPGATRAEVRRDGVAIAAWVKEAAGWCAWRITRVTV